MRALSETVVRALEDGELDRVWGLLEPHAASLGDDPELALAWLRALEHAPSRPTLQDEVRRAVGGGEDPRRVVAACAALNAAAQLRPLDLPPLPEGPAAQAARLAEQALARDPSGPLAGYLWINRANALRALGPEEDGRAQRAYAEALARDDRGWWHFDLAVLHKWRGRWEASLQASLAARERLGAVRPVCWNIALAATALGDGGRALEAWRALGFDPRLGEGSGLPFVEGIPPFQVRVPSRPSGFGLGEPEGEQFELVWVQPISPCHGVLASPTFGDAPVDYGDVVLWDGAPVLFDPPCFPLLEILRRGDERRLRFLALASAGEVEEVAGALGELGVQAFAHPRGRAIEGQQLIVGKLVAAATLDLSELRRRFEAALDAADGARWAVPDLYELCGDTKRAGREHQRWRGLARAAVKRGFLEP